VRLCYTPVRLSAVRLSADASGQHIAYATQVLSGCPAVASLLIERGAIGILPSVDSTYNHSNGGGAGAGGDAGDAGRGCSSSGIVVKNEEGK
jgi:hypothetical protein